MLVRNCSDPQFGYDKWEGKDDIKETLGSAGKDANGGLMSWEQIVEHSQADEYRSRFDPRIVNHPDNIVKMRYA